MLLLTAYVLTCLLKPLRANDDPTKYTGGTTLLGSTWLPYPSGDYAAGMRYELTSWTRDTGWATADDDFLGGLDTVIMDQTNCVYYTRWGAPVIEPDPYTLPAPTCTAWPPLWTNEMPATTTMDIYFATEAGINRIDFHDNASNSGYRETCPTTSTFD